MMASESKAEVARQRAMDDYLGRASRFAEREKEVERRLRKAVKIARECGATWAQVAEAVGITRQAAWKRFKDD